MKDDEEKWSRFEGFDGGVCRLSWGRYGARYDTGEEIVQEYTDGALVFNPSTRRVIVNIEDSFYDGELALSVFKAFATEVLKHGG